jgi:hypothetical protein
MIRLIPVCAMLALAACGSDTNTTGPLKLSLHGTVTRSGDAKTARVPAASVEVRAVVGGKADTPIPAEFKTQTDAKGNYALEVTADRGKKVLLSFKLAGSAAIHRTLLPKAGGKLSINASLEAVQPLALVAKTLTLQTGKLAIAGLPAAFTGQARVFNPVTEMGAFPGQFVDNQGTRLASGVFSTVQLKDAAGADVTKVAAPVDLKMELPPDTWSQVKDITPGTDRIEVPLYAFNEDEGAWVREGEGYLVGSDGETIPESTLASIRDGSFKGALFATGKVSHFSFWNVDWEVSTVTCITAKLLRPDGSPGAGCTADYLSDDVSGHGAVFAEDDGSFCVEVPRSEKPDEDLNGNGIKGEKTRYWVEITCDDQLYRLPLFEAASTDSSCGGACTDVGTIKLGPDSLTTPKACKVTGAVLDLADKPVAGAAVQGYDGNVVDEDLTTACGVDGVSCTPLATTDGQGKFTITTGLLLGMSLTADLTDVEVEPGHTMYRWGSDMLRFCPTGPVTLRVTEGSDSFALTVKLAGNEITWTPAFKADLIRVTDSGGAEKWIVVPSTPTATTTGPVTYGTAPSGFTASGSAAPLAVDDLIEVSGVGAGEVYPYEGSGSLTVP